MIVAIVGVFLLMDRFMAGLISGYLFWAMPLPLLIYSARYGWKASLPVLFSVVVIAFLTNGDLYTVVLSFITGVTGTVYGNGVREKKSNTWLLVTTILTTLVNYALTSVIIPIMYGYDIYEEYNMMVDMIAARTTMDVSYLYNMVKQLAILSIMLAAFMEAVLVHVIGHVILKRMRFEVEPLKQMQAIRLPKWLGWIMLGTIVLAVANTRFGFVPALQDSLSAVAMIAEVVFVVLGYMASIAMARLTGRRAFSLIAMLMMFLAPSALMVLGILDTVTDYRERMIEVYRNNGQKL